MDLTALISNVSGPAVFVVALVLIARELLRDRRAEKDRAAYTEQLLADVAMLKADNGWMSARLNDLESALVRAGVQLPDERPRPALLALTHHD